MLGSHRTTWVASTRKEFPNVENLLDVHDQFMGTMEKGSPTAGCKWASPTVAPISGTGRMCS